jgi:hypothetical protein
MQHQRRESSAGGGGGKKSAAVPPPFPPTRRQRYNAKQIFEKAVTVKKEIYILMMFLTYRLQMFLFLFKYS